MQEDIEEAKTKARKLREFLTSKGVELGHGEALDALSFMEGLANWNVLSAALDKQPAKQGYFCPHCGHRGKVEDIGWAKIQQGTWLFDTYITEGEGTRYACRACEKQFVGWDGGLLYHNRDHLVAIVAELEDGGWEVEAYSAIDVARALQVDMWDALKEKLKRLNDKGEALLSQLEAAVPACESVITVTGPSRRQALINFKEEREHPVLAFADY